MYSKFLFILFVSTFFLVSCASHSPFNTNRLAYKKVDKPVNDIEHSVCKDEIESEQLEALTPRNASLTCAKVGVESLIPVRKEVLAKQKVEVNPRFECYSVQRTIQAAVDDDPDEKTKKKKRRNVYADIALVSGIVSWLFFLFPYAQLLAIIMGIAGFRKARRTPTSGAGKALIGIGLAILSLVALGVLFALLVLL